MNEDTTRIWRVWVGVTVKSELNMREHWIAKHKRKKTQQKITRIWLLNEIPLRDRHFPGEYAIQFTRLKGRGQRDFDSDNLESAFKHVRDELSRFMCIDDGSKRLEFLPPIQRKPNDGEQPGLIIEILEKKVD